jgi:hypothetical protein
LGTEVKSRLLSYSVFTRMVQLGWRTVLGGIIVPRRQEYEREKREWWMW